MEHVRVVIIGFLCPLAKDMPVAEAAIIHAGLAMLQAHGLPSWVITITDTPIPGEVLTVGAEAKKAV